ncbi:MAG TPA: ribose-phosphate diphosphokinase [Telluria sp.]|nr:ribose-phosphate diphosphokinase [Telluria sp.]
MNAHPMLFALGASASFGQDVAAALGVPLSPHEEREFEDGEHKSRALVSARGRAAYVIHSLHGEPGHSANDRLCRLLFFIGALRDAGAESVTAVAPYLAYARKDQRTRPFDPVTTRYVAAMFEAVGTDAVLTMDVHNIAAYENAFRCRAEHIEAAPLFAAQLAPVLGGPTVVVAPDAGAVKRAEKFRQLLVAAGIDAGSALAEKYRSGGVLTGNLLVGEVEGRTAVIFDDLVSSGETLVRTARTCREKGAARVLAVATHAAFSPAASGVLADPALERLYVTDTVGPGRLGAGVATSKVTVLGCGRRFAAAIRSMHEGGPAQPDQPL